MNYFRHYKGNYYRFLSEARHSETLEELVVYQALYGEQAVWVRPKAMFFESVTLPTGEIVPRFAQCTEAEALDSISNNQLASLVDELARYFHDKGYVAEDFVGSCSLCGEQNEFILDQLFSRLKASMPDADDSQLDELSLKIYAELHRKLENF